MKDYLATLVSQSQNPTQIGHNLVLERSNLALSKPDDAEQRLAPNQMRWT